MQTRVLSCSNKVTRELLMARRKRSKKDDPPILALLDAPWQANVALAAVVFVVMRWLIPALAHTPLLTAFGSMASGFAPIAALFFLLAAGVAYVRNKARAPASPAQKSYEFAYPSTEPSTPDESFSRLRIVEGKAASASEQTAEADKAARTEAWTLELLRTLEWKRFELLCAEYFRILGKRVETLDHGADGGVDARVYATNSDVLEYAIQCKAWKSMVGVKELRELFGVMVHESAGKGVFMATSSFSSDAKHFAGVHSDKLFLVDGEKFLVMLSKLPDDKQKTLLAFATEGDYTTPTCASCGTKLVLRNNGHFWGCSNYPRCKTMLRVAGA